MVKYKNIYYIIVIENRKINHDTNNEVEIYKEKKQIICFIEILKV